MMSFNQKKSTPALYQFMKMIMMITVCFKKFTQGMVDADMTHSDKVSPSIAPTVCQEAVIGKSVHTHCTIGGDVVCKGFFTAKKDVIFTEGYSIVPPNAYANQTIGFYDAPCPSQAGIFLKKFKVIYVVEDDLPNGDQCTHEPVPEQKVFGYCEISVGTDMPTQEPTVNPTSEPTTLMPTVMPTIKPTLAPTIMPSVNPTTNMPTQAPTLKPTFSPLPVETFF